MIDYEKTRVFDYKKVFDIDRVNKALNLIGNPQESIKIIHIAGTKGKTSTSFYLADLIMLNTDKKVGVFTSPHIKSPTERIIINKAQISIDKMNVLMETVKKAVEDKNISLTYFELLTLVALTYFAEEKVDYVILETGLGGRLDATNVVKPILSIITRIDKDHTQILGKSIFKIAYEKLGIIKKSVPFIIGKQKLVVCFFIFLFVFFKGFLNNWVFKRIRVKRLDYRLVKFYNKNFSLYFSGPFYGLENFKTALKGFLFVFGEKFLKIKNYTSSLDGRFETYSIDNRNIVIFDGAHNKVAIKKLVSSIKILDLDRRFIIVFNCQKDKDYKSMIKMLSKIGSYFLIPELPNLATKEIVKYLDKNKIPYEIVSTEEINLIENDYLITGSFYIIEPLKIVFEKKFGERFVKHKVF